MEYLQSSLRRRLGDGLCEWRFPEQSHECHAKTRLHRVPDGRPPREIQGHVYREEIGWYYAEIVSNVYSLSQVIGNHRQVFLETRGVAIHPFFISIFLKPIEFPFSE